jgi:hypothetical protein
MVLFLGWRGAKWLTIVTIALCAATLASNTIYLPSAITPRFFLEKGWLAHQAWWRAAFYFHVVGASVCLMAGLPLMFAGFARWSPRWHRRLGYVYVNAVLWMAAPSGLVLAMFAKGGLAGTLGFTIAGSLWWCSTWSGYREIRAGDLPAHIRSMVRSYAWALSAPAFRAIQTGFYFVGLAEEPNYVVSLWLSIAASVWLAEMFVRRRQPRAAFFVSPSRA